jgi:hypothetical protein
VMLCPVELVPAAFVEPTHGMEDGCVSVVRRGKPLVPNRPFCYRGPTRPCAFQDTKTLGLAFRAVPGGGSPQIRLEPVRAG